MHEQRITKGLRFGVFVIKVLRHFRFIPNIWYESELKLARLRGRQLSKEFRPK